MSFNYVFFCIINPNTKILPNILQYTLLHTSACSLKKKTIPSSSTKLYSHLTYAAVRLFSSSPFSSSSFHHIHSLAAPAPKSSSCVFWPGTSLFCVLFILGLLPILLFVFNECYILEFLLFFNREVFASFSKSEFKYSLSKLSKPRAKLQHQNKFLNRKTSSVMAGSKLFVLTFPHVQLMYHNLSSNQT